MPARYSVIQYVPDPVRDERINIGVVVVGDGVIECKFVTNWERIRQFGGPRISFLRSFAKEFRYVTGTQRVLEEFATAPHLTEADLQRMIANWGNSLQLTPLRASLLSPHELLNDMSARLLVQPGRVKRQGRDRRVAANIATTTVRNIVVDRRGGTASDLLHTGLNIQGYSAKHRFDVGLRNGVPYFLAHGLSFETNDSEEREKNVRVTAYAVEDIHRVFPDLAIGLVILPPARRSEKYREALGTFNKLEATVIEVTSESLVRSKLEQIIPPEPVEA